MNSNSKRGFKKRWVPNNGKFRKKWRPREETHNFRPGNDSPEKQDYNVSFHSEGESSELEIANPKVLVLDTDTSMGPYQAWKSYMPCQLYDESIVTKLCIADKYLIKFADTQRQELDAHHSFTVDVKSLTRDKEFSSSWPEFLQELHDTPYNIIAYFGLAMHHILCKELAKDSPVADSSQSEDLKAAELPTVHAQFVGYDTLPFKNLKTNTYEKFVSIKGTVIRVGNVKPLCLKLAFSCNRCKTVQVILQPRGNHTTPNTCAGNRCASRSFQPLYNSPHTQLIAWQNINVQELAGDDQGEQGRVPRTVECELLRHLVNRCVPGDIVTICGTVQVIDPKEKSFGSVRSASMYILYILANSIECLREKNPASQEVMPGGLQLNMSDLYSVQDIHAHPNLFRLIVASLCPSIYGHEMVKAGMVLSLFGGTQRNDSDENTVPVRADSHILIVGDPGLGKTQMLLACVNASPRGVYVCGNTTTSSGLTVTMSKVEGGENVLDAGALVLADQGCCCIDEFDKMTNQHHALLEAMEQQTISIAKGGMSCTLPARTSIIAAANPVGGHYNKAKTVSENIKMNSALLSRFDLVFIVLDKADKELDNRMSAHVMAMHTANQASISSARLLDSAHFSGSFSQEQTTELIPFSRLKKYVAYARKYVHPKISPEACTVLQNFYIELRKQNASPNSTPITTRQLESMLRLTEARAKVELREVCTEEDAKEIVDIMKHSMVDTFSDEFGNIDFERSIHGSGMSKRGKAKNFLSHLNKVAERLSKVIFTIQELHDLAEEARIDTSGFRDFIESLNNQGYLLKKGLKLYKLQTL